MKFSEFRRGVLAISLVLSGTVAPYSPASAQALDEAGLKAAAARWAEAYNSGDVDGIAALYTDDAKLLPEGSEAVVGRDSILEFFKAMKQGQEPDTISFRNFEFYGQAPSVTEVSEVVIQDENGNVKALVKQILVRVMQDGEWKIHRDIWTSNGPMQAHSP